MLNSALRDHAHPKNLEAFLPYLKLFLKGLNKLPLIRKQVYRGVNVDLHEEYNQLQGWTFRWWAFSSTTQCESTSKTFLGEEGASTLFKIDGIGVDIAAFSAFPNESEVLLLPGTLTQTLFLTLTLTQILTLTLTLTGAPVAWHLSHGGAGCHDQRQLLGVPGVGLGRCTTTTPEASATY